MAGKKYAKDYRLTDSLDERGRIRTETEYIGAYYRFAGAADVDECVGQMMDWLCEQGITSFAALSRYARAYRKDWFRVLTAKRTVFMAQFCKSLQWEADKGMNPFDGNGGERATEG